MKNIRMLVYSVRMELPDVGHTVIEVSIVAANFEQVFKLIAGIYGKRVKILSITEK